MISLEALEVTEEEYEKRFLKPRKHGIWLSDEEVDVLNRYQIDYENCYTMNEILYQIDRILEEEEIEELDSLSIILAERNCYQTQNH